MAKPLIVEIPHDLGREEARRRLQEGTHKVQGLLAGSSIGLANMVWAEDRLDFAVTAMGQKVDGQIDVKTDTVRVEVRLPLLLALFAEKVRASLSRQGNLLLTKK